MSAARAGPKFAAEADVLTRITGEIETPVQKAVHSAGR